MKKHFFARALALVMCLSLLSTTAFAAVAFDPEMYVGDDGSLLSHKEVVGDQIIENSYDYYLDQDVNLDKTLVIKDGVNASIDLNGYNLSLNKDQVVNTETGKVTGNEKTGSVIEVTGNDTKLTVTDKNEDADYEHGNDVGSISGGYVQPQYGEGFGGGIKVDKGAELDFQGGTITNNAANNGGGIYVGTGNVTMSGDAKIDGNLAAHQGGGVYLNTQVAGDAGDKSVFTMNGGSITNNTADGTSSTGAHVGAGGGIAASVNQNGVAPDYTAININNGTITGNHSYYNGGGIYILNGTASIKDSEISGNTTGGNGGGLYVNGSIINGANSKVDIAGSVISGNSAAKDGGGLYLSGSNNSTGFAAATVDATSKIYNNEAGKMADDILKNGNSTLTLPDAGSMSVVGSDGKNISGWYLDDGYRWGNNTGKFAYDKVDVNNGGNLFLKAAHDRYFKVIDSEGKELADVENGTELDLSTLSAPTYEGHEFAGWTLDGESVTSVTVDREITLKATWEHIAVSSETTKEATCTEDGVMTYTCSCGATRTETIPATGHTPGETVVENEVPAQVGVEGSYDEVTYCTACGEETSRNTVTTEALEPEQPTDPDTPENPGDVTIPDPDVPMAGGPDTGDTTIEDEAVPLAGLVTLAQLLDALRAEEQAEDVELPEDFKWIDHQYAQAIYWGLEQQLVSDTEEEPLDPDAIVTVALMQDVLDNFVTYYKPTEDFTLTVEGEADEIVMDLGERLTAFYADLEAVETK